MDVKLAIFNARSAQPSYSCLGACHRTLELDSKTNSPKEGFFYKPEEGFFYKLIKFGSGKIERHFNL